MSSVDSKWGTFAAGILIGGVVVAGSTYIALRYAPASVFSSSTKDPKRWEDKSKSRHGIRKVFDNSNGSKLAPSQRSKHATANSNGDGMRKDGMRKDGMRHSVLRQREDGIKTPEAYTRGEQDGFGSSPSYAEVAVGKPHLQRQDTLSDGDMVSDLVTEPASVLYAGPADRSNPAVHDALLHTAFASATGPSHHPLSNYQASPAMPISPNAAPPNQQHTTSHYPAPVVQSSMNHSNTTNSGLGLNANTNASGNATMMALQAGNNPTNANSNGPTSHPSTITTADALASEGRMIEDAALHEQYSKVILPEPLATEETEEVCWLLQRALDLRKHWVFKPVRGPESVSHLPEATLMSECIGTNPFSWSPQPVAPYRAEMVDGVMTVYDIHTGGKRFCPPGSAVDFFSDMHWLLKISALGHVRSFTHSRLQLLEQKFNLHVMLNADKEFLAQKSAPHRDFYNVRKVDTHVHHSACMHQKHLLRFIKSKLKKEGDEVVIFRDGKYLTLKEVFESLNLTPYDLSVDTLDVHADKNIFHRFDKFNLKYNPFGQSRLREVFIKQDNLIHGRYLAELTREVFNDLEASKYQHTEYRISVYGRKPVEWDTLAAWVVQNRLYSDNNLWMIQVPRLYNVYKEQGIVENFQQLLDNIFIPLFEATIDPNSHPMLHVFLGHVSGFDLVDDESKPERRPNKHMPTPAEWNTKHNPAYSYYTYYMYANLYVLNRLREERGYTTFSLRPHSGEAGDLDHLVSTFFLAENIAHGINLRKAPCLQYLYYAAQIGLCMSPLSNNSLFLDYHRNPFPQFFARGLSVSLSTDDPLQIHLTREPLVEEYSVAAQVWKLSGTDLCEVARNSVLHSGFPSRLKMHWVHTEFWRMGPEGNNIQKTNVPALRMVFRRDCHAIEVGLLSSGFAAHGARLRAKEMHTAQD